MPKIIPPPAKPIECDIALFAKAYFNIQLTSAQMQMIAELSTGRGIKGFALAKQSSKSIAYKVVLAYLQEGMKPGGRVRLPQHPLPPREKMKGFTHEAKVLALIQRPGGAYNFELARVALKYTSVISVLRQEGHNIVADRQYLKNGKASNTWKYRIGGY